MPVKHSSTADLPGSEADDSFARLFWSEFERQWSPRSRRLAVLALAGVLLLQLLVTAVLEPFLWGNRSQVPAPLLQLLQPFASPFLPVQNRPGEPVPAPLWLLGLGLSQWLAYTVVRLIGPTFAARSVPPDPETLPTRELVPEGLTPRGILFARAGAAMLPFAVLALAVGLLGAGILTGLHLTGKQALPGIQPPVPPEVRLPTRPDIFFSHCVFLAKSVVQWLSLLVLLGALGTACRSRRAALLWGYAATLLIAPLLQFVLNQGAGALNLWAGPYRYTAVTLVVSILALMAAAILFRWAARDLEHPGSPEL